MHLPLYKPLTHSLTDSHISQAHSKMVSLESQNVQPHSSRSMDPPPPSSSSPRISFSSDFLDDDNDYISISPHSHRVHSDLEQALNLDFEFLSNNDTNNATADQLFFEGKLLPFWQVQHHSDKLSKIKIKDTDQDQDEEQEVVVIAAAAATSKDHHQEMKSLDMGRVNTWFVDEDPSPRPPKCTVLWKELLRLKKQRNVSSLSPSSSTSSSSSSMSVEEDKNNKNKDKDKEGGGLWNKEKHVRRIKKGLERTRSTASMIRIRPMVNVPICTHTSSSSLPPLFPLNTNNRFFHTSRD